MDDRLVELRRLEHLSGLADARLGVAEQLGWPLAFLAGVISELKWDNSYLNVSVFVGVYILTTWPFRGPAKRAEDVYFRAAKLGKYARNPFEPTS